MTAMYDIERTEVVKGPQGTLFGRNSIAGAVSVITNKPEPDFGASAELTLADWDHVEANAMVNFPLGDQWALRVAGYILDNKGFLKNDQGGDELGFHQISAGRVSLRARRRQLRRDADRGLRGPRTGSVRLLGPGRRACPRSG